MSINSVNSLSGSDSGGIEKPSQAQAPVSEFKPEAQVIPATDNGAAGRVKVSLHKPMQSAHPSGIDNLRQALTRFAKAERTAEVISGGNLFLQETILETLLYKQAA